MTCLLILSGNCGYLVREIIVPCANIALTLEIGTTEDSVDGDAEIGT